MKEQYSITEAKRIYLDQMPLYAKKKVTVFSKIFWGREAVKNAQNQTLQAQGYLGKVQGVYTDNGVIYFGVDDELVYNDGIKFWVEANKDEIVTNEADAPPIQTTWVDSITDVVNSVGSGLNKLALWGIAIFTAGMIIKSVVTTKIKDHDKE